MSKLRLDMHIDHTAKSLHGVLDMARISWLGSHGARIRKEATKEATTTTIIIHNSIFLL